MEEHKPIRTHLDSTSSGSEAGAEADLRGKQLISDGEVRLSIGKTVIVAEKREHIECSPYFASLLHFHDMDTVSLEPPENVHLGTFLAMLYSLTNAEVKLHISATNMWDCIVLSKYFQLEHVEEECYSSLRKMLRTLTMDELLRLWRNGHACAIQQVTSLMETGISLKMDGTGDSQSMEFLDMTVDELVLLMSDDGFLPLVEADAVIAWFEQDSGNRSKPPIVERILAELVWDDSIKTMIESLPWEYRLPETMPKRMIGSNTDEAQLQAGRDRIVMGNYTYQFNSSGVFYRTDSVNGERQDLMDLNLDFNPDDQRANAAVRFGFCRVKVADGDKIGLFASYCQRKRVLSYAAKEFDEFRELENNIALYDISIDFWYHLPYLPFERVGGVMIQCGSFLYLIGGTEQKRGYATPLVNACHCYRLDLSKYSPREPEYGDEWDRIADLNAPRIEHCARIQYNRIIISGGRTETRGHTEEDSNFTWKPVPRKLMIRP